MSSPRKARSGMIAPVRVTPEEERAIHAAAKALGMSVPDAVRALPFLVRAVAGLRAEKQAAEAALADARADVRRALLGR